MSPGRKSETLSRIAGSSSWLVVRAAAVHIATLAALADRFSVVVPDTGALRPA